MAALNAGWQAASEEMYKATQGQPGAQGNPAGGPEGAAHAENGKDPAVTDVDFEEVK